MSEGEATPALKRERKGQSPMFPSVTSLAPIGQSILKVLPPPSSTTGWGPSLSHKGQGVKASVPNGAFSERMEILRADWCPHRASRTWLRLTVLLVFSFMATGKNFT